MLLPFPPELSAVGARGPAGPAVLFVGQDSSDGTTSSARRTSQRWHTMLRGGLVSRSRRAARGPAALPPV